jgi:hypothetical protein
VQLNRRPSPIFTAAGDQAAADIVRDVSSNAWQHVHLIGAFDLEETESQIDIDALAAVMTIQPSSVGHRKSCNLLSLFRVLSGQKILRLPIACGSVFRWWGGGADVTRRRKSRELKAMRHDPDASR